MIPDLHTEDQAARDTLRTDFDSTLFVDAGAGTGKTTAIVGRIVELVASGRVEMKGLVAITFTEAAAAELRARVREELQRAALDGARPMEQRERCAVATRSIDEASIDTIHAFAADLLRTYPLHAGMPPDFRTLDEIEEDLEFEERFRTWFENLARDDAPHRETVRRALLLGLDPARIEKVARALHENHDLLATAAAWAPPAPADPVELAHDCARRLMEARDLLPYGPPGAEQSVIVESLAFARERLSAARTKDEALAALLPFQKIPQKGRQDDWQTVDGTNALKRLKHLLKDIEHDVKEALVAERTALFCDLLDALKQLVLDYAAERKLKGVATFQDLLCWARDLLRDSDEVRSRVQRRWSRVFIDEFQDTDPLQAEMAFYLCANKDAPLPENWREIELETGKLCLVGDPKQSIYRFRRADIALYQAVRDLVAKPLVLSMNFRSVPDVLEMVNSHFQRTMTFAEGVQPEYQALAADASAAGPALWSFGDPVAGGQGDVWSFEAEGVADTVLRILQDPWQVSEGKGPGRTQRGARPGDICVLIPSRTNLRRLERAFEVRQIAYRVESGEIVIGTQEVRDLLACLRAIDDPSDQVALVAALRSPVYGCSDVELAEWVNAGGRLDYTYIGNGPEGRIRTALEDLAVRHAGRNHVSVPALVERFVDDRMLVAAVFGERRPRESWRRYRYVARRARAFAGTGRTTLREFVEWMEGLGRSQARDVSGSIIELDEEAVRVLTVHRAKGLEFPVVIMTGLGSTKNFNSPTVVSDRLRDRVHAGVKDTREQLWSSPGYAEACDVEKTMDAAEGIRLAYVAATRARDHLVLGLHHKEGGKETMPSLAFAETLEALGGAVGRVEPGDAPTPAGAPVITSYSLPELMEAESAWVAQREASLAAATGTPFATATGRASVSEGAPEPAGEPEPARHRRGRAGTSLGRAVHSVLQAVDLGSLAGAADLARAEAAAEGIPDRAAEIERLVRQACATEPIRRAVAGGRYRREVPIGAPDGGEVLEGFIDLLFETPEGYEVVDYKTDAVREGEIEERMDRYRTQGAAYADLLKAITGKPPVAVSFVFVAAGQVVRLDPQSGGQATEAPQ